MTKDDIRMIRSRALSFIPDKAYLSLMYFLKMKKRINWKNPQSFNEKLQWLKIYDHRPEYIHMVDKYEAKEYVASIIGEQYIVPTLGVWDRFDDIDFTLLPDKFVLKCTHDSGGVVICKNKQLFNIEEARKKINKSLHNNYYFYGREWPYKHVRPRIIAEVYMEDSKVQELRDYKFFCFGGVCRCFKVDFDRFIEHHANYYDPNGNLLDFGEADYVPNFQKAIKLPESLEIMKKLAAHLSKNVPFLRTDFYDVDGNVYFGELTLFPASGFGKFTSDESDEWLGKWIELPKSHGGGYAVILPRAIGILKNQLDIGISDFKLFCFNGEPKIILVCSERFANGGLKEDFFDADWNHLNLSRPKKGNALIKSPRPSQLELMKKIAKALSKDILFSRIDFYEISGQIYFGEITLYPASGFEGFDPDEWDKKLGDWIDMRKFIGGGTDVSAQ